MIVQSQKIVTKRGQMLEFVKANSSNAIGILALGEKHFQNWKTNSLPSLEEYCIRNDIHLLVQTESIGTLDDNRKSTWQKLLIPKQIKHFFPHIKNVCYLDTDIICNPYAESIFDSQEHGKLHLVSQFKNLPFNLEIAQRRMVFFRKRFYDKTYPLDSSVFMSPQQIFSYHGFQQFDDYACAGVFMASIDLCADFLESIYYKYDDKFVSITEGDEPVFNFEIQKHFEIKWLPYKFQTLWNFEMSTKYLQLYDDENISADLINSAILSTLMNSVFLHFAGSWNEKNSWHKNTFFAKPELLEILSEYVKFSRTPVSGKPKGMLRPRIK
jgi:hypothetical protein